MVTNLDAQASCRTAISQEAAIPPPPPPPHYTRGALALPLEYSILLQQNTLLTNPSHSGPVPYLALHLICVLSEDFMSNGFPPGVTD